MNKSFLFGYLIAIIILVGTPIALYTIYQTEITSRPSESSKLVNISIKEGEGLQEIGQTLFEAGLITNKNIFYIYGRASGKSSSIIAGTYQIPANSNIKEVYELFDEPIPEEISIAIPEGLRADEIAEIFASGFGKGNFNKEEYINLAYSPPNSLLNAYEFLDGSSNLEGFLFPDTYRFFPDASTKDVILKQLDTFEEKVYLQTKDLTNSYFPSDFSYYDAINLASIVEREGMNASEWTSISSILLNRLNGKMDGIKFLQTDATLLYENKDWVLSETNTIDKDSDSLYNTYRLEGLPPTPICNPGSGTIMAVFSASETEYLYYNHKNGKFFTARTYNEHISNL